jgi:hypothetical protein
MRTITMTFGVMLALSACTTHANDTSADSGVALRVVFWDYTENGVSEQPRIALRGGEDSWLPEMERRFNKHTFSGLEVGTTQTFMFDPFGNEELVIPVDVPITDEFCPSSCVPYTLNFGVWDAYVRVWGVVEPRDVARSDYRPSSQNPPLQVRLVWGQ